MNIDKLLRKVFYKTHPMAASDLFHVNILWLSTQSVFTCPRLTIETPEECVKSVQN